MQAELALTKTNLRYESIVLASSTVSVGVSVFRTRLNVHALQELMHGARRWLAK